MLFNDMQQFIIDKSIEWYHDNRSFKPPFQYAGNAGTGKSVVMGEIIRRLGLNPVIDVAAMSYIGSASILMRMRGLLNAKTIHSWLYDIVEVPLLGPDGKPMIDKLLNKPIKTAKFIPKESLPEDIKLIVIDEAYTVPMSMRNQIERFGINILAAGDSGQLPPISEAPAYLTPDQNVYYLTQVMRQEGRDDIIFLANKLRLGMDINYGYYGNSLVINRNEITDDMLLWADTVICGTNRTRDYYNNRIRSILGYSGDMPKYGEKVVCRKNDWLTTISFTNGGEISLVNGLIGRVVNNPDISTFDGKQFTIDFVPDLINNIIFPGVRCNYRHINAPNKERLILRKDKYSVGNMFEYAYAITGWIAQGSQWNNVLYIEDYVHPSLKNQLNYVGATRAVKNLIYAKI